MRQAKALVLPLVALVVVPVFVLAVSGSTVFGLNFFSPLLQVLLGLIVCVAGIKLIVVTVKAFTEMGRDAPAPWDPASSPVDSGLYAYMRNPMIAGVMVVLLGESLLLGSLGVFIWAVVFFAGCTAYFHYLEEKELENRFGEAYLEYRRNVPMWLPRTHAWSPPGADEQARALEDNENA